MTSMDFFKPVAPKTDEPPEWGTGKLKAEQNTKIDQGPTWHYSGRPTEQYYTLTKLKLSNVRSNDQLLPKPQESEMGELMIQKPFPAEHPYTSHIPRFAILPKFAETPEDPKRGATATKNPEMPANPFDVQIVQKTKGSALRRELQALPEESQRKPLKWLSKSFDQLVKSPSGGQQSYYPTPPKLFVPNLEERSDMQCIKGNMTVTPRAANTTKNLERDQWITTYDRNHTGLGPANPMALDNLEEKSRRPIGLGEDDLRPRSTNTFDPPRPYEGRLARGFTPRPLPQIDRYPNPLNDPSYKPKPTLHEKEEDRLWNGTVYLTLPENADSEDEQWKTLENTAHHERYLQQLAHAQANGEPETSPFNQSDPPTREESYLEKMRRDHHDKIQQVEALNRWNVLEAHTPSHDLVALNNKLDKVPDNSQPNVFYNHEAKYQQERAGLYKTSYDPYTFQQSMNKDENKGSHLFDITDCHKDALNLNVGLNDGMTASIRNNRTMGGPPGSVPQFHSQPSQHELFAPFDRTKKLQKAVLQPHSSNASIRTLENGIVLTESTQGNSYNTPKFLQENTLPLHARNEPLGLISHENKDLSKVRAFPRDLEMSLPPADLPTRRSPVLGSARLGTKPTADPSNMTSLPVPLTSRVAQTARSADQYDYFSSMEDRSKKPVFDYGYKNDDFFNWKVGCGTPRPQTVLLKLQNSFTKSDTRKKFHRAFPETNPDLRENIIRGKKHTFGGFNAQILRGTPVC